MPLTGKSTRMSFEEGSHHSTQNTDAEAAEEDFEILVSRGEISVRIRRDRIIVLNIM